MSTAPGTARTTEASPRFKARMAGLFYLLTFLTGGVAVMSGKLVVSGDAAATANKILSNEFLFRWGFAAYLLNVVCYLVVTLLFYELFKPVNRSLSLLAVFFSLVGCATQASASLFYLGTWGVLNGQFVNVFEIHQWQALGLLFLKLHAQAFNIGLVFFGVYCLLIGYLVFRSTFLPRTLGVLMMIGGLGWLTFLVPPLAKDLSPYVLVPGIVGEGSLTLWLLFLGVNVERWREQAGAVG